MLYLLLIEKADSFKFAPEKRKTKPAAVPERISNRKKTVSRSDFVETQIMNLSLQTQKADSFRFAPPPEKLLY
jgi:hypothetical protein